MKRAWIVVVMLVAIAHFSFGQKPEVENAAENTEKNVENAAENTRDDIPEAADMKDKIFDGKMGPDGQTIYIDKHSKYYYINDEGKKVYLAKIELRDKPKKDKD